jgi:hypothetical protein
LAELVSLFPSAKQEVIELKNAVTNVCHAKNAALQELAELKVHVVSLTSELRGDKDEYMDDLRSAHHAVLTLYHARLAAKPRLSVRLAANRAWYSVDETGGGAVEACVLSHWCMRALVAFFPASRPNDNCSKARCSALAAPARWRA